MEETYTLEQAKNDLVQYWNTLRLNSNKNIQTVLKENPNIQHEDCPHCLYDDLKEDDCDQCPMLYSVAKVTACERISWVDKYRTGKRKKRPSARRRKLYRTEMLKLILTIKVK